MLGAGFLAFPARDAEGGIGLRSHPSHEHHPEEPAGHQAVTNMGIIVLGEAHGDVHAGRACYAVGATGTTNLNQSPVRCCYIRYCCQIALGKGVREGRLAGFDVLGNVLLIIHA